MGRRMQRAKDWIALTTVVSFILGLLILSPLYFFIGLFILAIIVGILALILKDWKETIFQSQDRLRISYTKNQK